MMNDLKLFVEWYKGFHSSRVLSVFETCIIGHYKATQKEANAIVKECRECGYIKVTSGGNFEILI